MMGEVPFDGISTSELDVNWSTTWAVKSFAE
jgi:hypothetical protein